VNSMAEGGEKEGEKKPWRQQAALRVVMIVLGQFLSICITGSGISSQIIARDFQLRIPTTQVRGRYRRNCV